MAVSFSMRLYEFQVSEAFTRRVPDAVPATLLHLPHAGNLALRLKTSPPAHQQNARIIPYCSCKLQGRPEVAPASSGRHGRNPLPVLKGHSGTEANGPLSLGEGRSVSPRREPLCLGERGVCVSGRGNASLTEAQGSSPRSSTFLSVRLASPFKGPSAAAW